MDSINYGIQPMVYPMDSILYTMAINQPMEVLNKPSWITTILGMVLIGTAGYSYGQQLELVNFWHAGESRAQKRSNGEFT